MQGYAAREFAKQGVRPGELAIISKEAVSSFFAYWCWWCRKSNWLLWCQLSSRVYTHISMHRHIYTHMPATYACAHRGDEGPSLLLCFPSPLWSSTSWKRLSKCLSAAQNSLFLKPGSVLTSKLFSHKSRCSRNKNCLSRWLFCVHPSEKVNCEWCQSWILD